jgi:hypothetical protein
MKKRQQQRIRVPMVVRQELLPYSDLFETVVIPYVDDLGQKEISYKTKDSFHQLISNYLRAKKLRQHPVIVYYGLMLCCYYWVRYGVGKSSPSKRTLVVKARQLIRLAYLYRERDEVIFICG